MKQFIFSVRDDLNGFGQLFTAPSVEFAKRDFAAAVNNGPDNSPLAFSPKDFGLFVIGTFDSEKGMIESQLPDLVVRGDQLVG